MKRTRCLSYLTGLVPERDVTLCGRSDEHMVPASDYPTYRRPIGICPACFKVYRTDMEGCSEQL